MLKCVYENKEYIHYKRETDNHCLQLLLQISNSCPVTQHEWVVFGMTAASKV